MIYSPPHGAEPPAMVVVSLNDSRFKNIPKIYSTLVVKRKSVGVYKGRLCARGDSIPLTHTSFTSSPTVHRCGVKIMCMIAVLFSFQMRSLDVSQAFLQSDNLAESDRCIVIPPNMVKLPWTGELHSPTVNLKNLPPPTHGFLILKPLYGTRDAPLRWFMKLRKSLLSKGLRQMKSDICMYSMIESDELIGALIIHVDDILYVGNSRFINLVESAIKQFRVGETEILTQEKELLLPDWRFN